MCMQDCHEAGYNILYFTPLSTKRAWARLYPDQPVTNTISSRLTATYPLPIPSRSSSVSTSPITETPPSQNSPSNAHFDPKTSLIVLMHQMLQKNATLITHLQNQPSPPSVQLTPIDPIYKPQSPPFQKRYGTPSTTPLLLAQLVTYKSEACYSIFHNCTCTTQANKHLRVTISYEIMASIPRKVSSMFLNHTIFDSEGIFMLSQLLTHLNSSSSENLILAISDLTCLEMGLGELIIDYILRVHGISQRMKGVTMEKIIPLFAIARLDYDR